MLRAGLKFLIKDALRGARYTMRRSTHVAPPIDFPGRRHLTRMADTVLTSIEETVVTLRYGSDLTDDMIRSALQEYESLAATIGKSDFESRFASKAYRLSKAILARRGLDTIYISELAYTRAACRIVSRARGAGAPWQTSLFAAEVACALVEASPIRGMPTSDADALDDVFRSDTNAAAAFALGLAVAAWLTRGEGVSPVDCVNSASEIVGAAFGRLEKSLRASDPTAALATIFAELAAFVP
jgi:hypothetical protein